MQKSSGGTLLSMTHRLARRDDVVARVVHRWPMGPHGTCDGSDQTCQAPESGGRRRDHQRRRHQTSWTAPDHYAETTVWSVATAGVSSASNCHVAAWYAGWRRPVCVTHRPDAESRGSTLDFAGAGITRCLTCPAAVAGRHAVRDGRRLVSQPTPHRRHHAVNDFVMVRPDARTCTYDQSRATGSWSSVSTVASQRRQVGAESRTRSGLAAFRSGRSLGRHTLASADFQSVDQRRPHMP